MKIKRAGIILTVLVAVGVSGLIGRVVYRNAMVKKETEQNTKDFIVGLYSEDPNKAYDLASSRSQNLHGRQDFHSTEENAEQIKSVEITKYTELGNGEIGIAGQIKSAQSQNKETPNEPDQNINRDFAVKLIKEFDDWKIDSYNVK